MAKDHPGTYLVGVAGGSASGKTTFLNLLKGQFRNDELAVISQDQYYKGLSEQIKDENGQINFDLPEGIDFGRLIKDVKRLKQGHVVEMVEYTFNNPNKFPGRIVIEPASVLLIEGNFIYTHRSLAKMFDLTLFIEARSDLMFARRMERDQRERGMSKEEIEYQWHNHVIPSFDAHLLPYRDNVDMVIMNNRHVRNSTRVIADHIRSFI